jgi:hypothetical protein
MNLVEAIEFPVFVNGKPMTASVIEANENPVQFSYRVQFSDGYEDVFTLDEGLIEADKGEVSNPYLKAIRSDIPQVIGLDTNSFYHIFQDRVNNILTNIWVIEKEYESGEIYYGVYYNEYYRFEFRLTDGKWVPITRSKEPGASFDRDLAIKIEQLLYSVV